jgi:S-formylglutathione hydrolase FrmB
MGGYGALYLFFNYPDKFNSTVALTPANMTTRILNHRMVTPINEAIYGKDEAIKLGKAAIGDITDSFDLITSKDHLIIPSIKRDNNGNIINLNEQAAENWLKYDLNYVIKQKFNDNSNEFSSVKLLLNCHRKDEYGFADETRKLHNTLVELGIDHHFEIYKDYRAKLAPHMLGIAYKILPAIKFSIQFFN